MPGDRGGMSGDFADDDVDAVADVVVPSTAGGDCGPRGSEGRRPLAIEEGLGSMLAAVLAAVIALAGGGAGRSAIAKATTAMSTSAPPMARRVRKDGRTPDADAASSGIGGRTGLTKLGAGGA